MVHKQPKMGYSKNMSNTKSSNGYVEVCLRKAVEQMELARGGMIYRAHGDGSDLFAYSSPERQQLLEALATVEKAHEAARATLRALDHVNLQFT